MMLHNVLRVFHDVLLVARDVLIVVHGVSECFTCDSWCFTMFNSVLWCLASRATIGVPASATARPPIASGIGDNSAEIGDDAAGIVDIAANVIPCQTLSWMETGVTLFLEDKFQRGWAGLGKRPFVNAVASYHCVLNLRFIDQQLVSPGVARSLICSY